MKNPYFSIIVALAPDKEVDMLLESLKGINYAPEKYEIIIEKGTNISINRNRGVAKARGEIIAFVDSDAIVSHNWLNNAERFFVQYHDIYVVGGPQLTPENDTFFGKISELALSSVFGGATIRNRYRKAKLNFDSGEKELAGVNMFCRKEVFNQVQFNLAFFWCGDDVSFLNECVEKGFKVAYSPDIVVYHQRRSNFFSLAKQIFNYACVRPRIRRTKENRLTTFLFAVPTIFLFYLVFLPVLFWLNAYLIVPLFLYLICNLLSTIIITLKEKEPLGIVMLPLIFLTIHLSYGAGYTWGLFKRPYGKTAG